MTGRADHKGFTPPLCHEDDPRGLWQPGLVEISEFADVVNHNFSALVADLAGPLEQPKRQLFPGVDNPFRDVVP
jgi:hypothetical protein